MRIRELAMLVLLGVVLPAALVWAILRGAPAGPEKPAAESMGEIVPGSISTTDAGPAGPTPLDPWQRDEPDSADFPDPPIPEPEPLPEGLPKPVAWLVFNEVVDLWLYSDATADVDDPVWTKGSPPPEVTGIRLDREELLRRRGRDPLGQVAEAVRLANTAQAIFERTKSGPIRVVVDSIDVARFPAPSEGRSDGECRLRITAHRDAADLGQFTVEWGRSAAGEEALLEDRDDVKIDRLLAWLASYDPASAARLIDVRYLTPLELPGR